jgi:hypothetical protein
MTEPDDAAPPGVLFHERVSATRRDWRWLPVVFLVTALGVSPIAGGLAALAWFFNVVRYRNAVVLVDAHELRVGKRSVRLAALELSTLGEAGNTWPWRVLNRRYLGANPFWTDQSVGLRGLDAGKRYWVAVGTNRRDELVSTLNTQIPVARAREQAAGTWSPASARALPKAAWHPDPWDPSRQLRWWDGTQWTGWTHPKPGAAPAADPGDEGNG